MARNRRSRSRAEQSATEELLPSKARQVLETVAPDAQAGYERARAAAKAATAQLGKKGRVAMALAGLALLAGVGSVTTGLARQGALRAGAAIAGPTYRVQCQLPSGNWGVCGWNKK